MISPDKIPTLIVLSILLIGCLTYVIRFVIREERKEEQMKQRREQWEKQREVQGMKPMEQDHWLVLNSMVQSAGNYSTTLTTADQ